MKRTLYSVTVVAIVCTFAAGEDFQPPSPGLARVMKDKLKNAQILVEGMALGDFAKIEKSADALIQLTNTTEWMVHKTPRYQLYSNDFRRAVETMHQKAKNKNIDGVALAYVDVALSCFRCHQYVRELRDASLPLLPSDIAHDE